MFSAGMSFLILVGFPFHSDDDKIITNITLLIGKRLDPDFSVQSVNEIHVVRFETFHLRWFHAPQAYDPSRYFFSADGGDGTQKAGWIMRPLPRVKSLRLFNRYVKPNYRNYVAENMLSGVELRILPSQVSALTLEIILQKIYGSNASNYEVAFGVVRPEIMLQKTCFLEVEAEQVPS